MISLEKIQEDVFLLHFVATNFLNLKYKVYCFPFLLIGFFLWGLGYESYLFSFIMKESIFCSE